MFYELRQYRMMPGQKENWVRFMEDEIIPFQVSKGMVISGSFVAEEGRGEDDLYVWIRRFENEDEKIRLYKAVYESDHWKTMIAPRIPAMMDAKQIKVSRIEPTRLSVLQ